MFTGIGNWGIPSSWVGWGWLMLFVSLLILAGIIIGSILLVIWAIRRIQLTGITSTSSNGNLTAKQILQARFARGEITREQYELILNDIN